MAGVSRLKYSPEIRLIRVMCSGRVDLEFIFRAFFKGMDGVFIGGCNLNECNYITHGNYDALSNVLLFRKLMERIGLNPERLSIEFMSAGDGILLVELINDFTKKVKRIGPLGKSEGLNKDHLKFNLDAVHKLIPYVRLVERERLRVPSKSKDAYHAFFASDEFNRLFDELIGEKLTISQITSLLREKPLSMGEIAESLGLNSSEVSRHMNTSSRHGLVKYDENREYYTLAHG
jgi:F420-non-reducing hydrogenase iron-sulfur subunit